MLKTVSAYEARTNFGELLNLAYYSNYEIVVEKMGKPMVKITKANRPSNKTLSVSEVLDKYAGAWNNSEMGRYTKSFRKNFKLIK